ncbi:MAG: hypothetical protein AB8B53_00100 [Flavobacteriales bacterium]
MKTSTLAAALISSSLLLFSCGGAEHSHDHNSEETNSTITPEQTKEADEAIQKMDEVAKEIDQKQEELDKALEDLGI